MTHAMAAYATSFCRARENDISMNKQQKWIEEHPVTWWFMQKISGFLWFFAKFNICILIWALYFKFL